MLKRCLVVLLALPSFAAAQTADEKKATVAYVQSLQTNIGGFTSMRPRPNIRIAPTLRATSAGIRALKHWGGELPDADGAKKYVLDCFDAKSGGFSDRPGNEPEVYATATGLMAAEALKLPLDDYRKKTVPYFVREAKNFEDTRIAVAGLEAIGSPAALLGAADTAKWKALLPEFKPEARSLGSATAALYRLGGTLDAAAAEKVVSAIQADQRADGGFGHPDKKESDLETTYRVMRSLANLKATPKDADKLRAFVAKCRNEDGGYGMAPGEGSTVGPTYFAGIVLHWLDASAAK